MLEPTAYDRARPRSQRPCYCDRCDLLVGLDGFHVIDVGEHAGLVRVVVETPAEQMGCRSCGVIAHSHGRREADAHRRALLRAPGEVGLAQTDVALC